MHTLSPRLPAPVSPTAGGFDWAAHPDTGAGEVHVVGTAGPLPTFQWQVSAAGSLAPPAWATGPYGLDAVVSLPGGPYTIPAGNPQPSITGQSATQGSTVQLAAAFALCMKAGTSVAAPTTLGPNVTEAGGGSGAPQWLVIPAFANGLLLAAVSGSPSLGRVNGFPIPAAPAGLSIGCSRPDLEFTTAGTVAVIGSP